MPLQLSNLSGNVRVNGAPAFTNQNISFADYISLDPGASVSIDDNGVPAAWVSAAATAPSATPSSTASRVSTYSPPTLSLYQIYYLYSYRWQLKTPGGTTGVRI
jgi:hypothetical protein